MAVQPEPVGNVAAPPSGRLRDLGVRVLSALVLGPLFIVLSWKGGVPFVALVTGLTLSGTYEFRKMLQAKSIPHSAWLLYVSALVLPFAHYQWQGAASGVVIGALFIAVLWILKRQEPQGALHSMAAMVFGVVYISWLFSHLVLLRELPGQIGMDDSLGFQWVLCSLVIVWVSDTAAYLVGSMWGRHKLAPRISPKKSVEGALGAVLLTAAAGGIMGYTFLSDALSPWAASALAALACLAGQIGDLAISLLKRDTGIKDASKLIPGHGGVLDRFDSILWVGPLVYYALLLLVF